jgi:hypothetical protein
MLQAYGKAEHFLERGKARQYIEIKLAKGLSFDPLEAQCLQCGRIAKIMTDGSTVRFNVRR